MPRSSAHRLARAMWIAALAITALLPHGASARYLQDGSKLVPFFPVNNHELFGEAVAISADGKTAIVGGLSNEAAAWVFVRTAGGLWSAQQKLLGEYSFGTSVALSADGNTAIVGNEDGAYVFSRSNGLWNPSGVQLKANDSIGSSFQGSSVALSADGNMAVVGGPGDNDFVGAAWVWVRKNGTWSKLQKLVASNSVGQAWQGVSVALAANKSTIIIGGPSDTGTLLNGNGAAWIWRYSYQTDVFYQQTKLFENSTAANNAQQGYSVAMSSDGNTALIGGPNYNGGRGAAWLWASSNGLTWSWIGGRMTSGTNANNGTSVALSADGTILLTGGKTDNGGVGGAWIWRRFGATVGGEQKLPASGATAGPEIGTSVALAGDGSIALTGGRYDDGGKGAVWAFRLEAAHDFGADSKSDILWRSNAGDISLWQMNGGSASSATSLGNVAPNWSVVAQRDFNGDGKNDMLWASSAGDLAMWLMNGAAASSVVRLGNVGTSWSVVSTADFNGDGKGDILWRNAAGDTSLWLMNGTAASQVTSLGNIGANWGMVGTADFNGDGKADILWRDTSGNLAMWLMNGAAVSQVANLGNIGVNWAVAGTADFNGDGRSDILWRDVSGNVALWMMNGASASSVTSLGNVGANWSVASNGDYNGDGKGDILWRSSTGDIALWLMNGATATSVTPLGNVPTNWAIQNANAN